MVDDLVHSVSDEDIQMMDLRTIRELNADIGILDAGDRFVMGSDIYVLHIGVRSGSSNGCKRVRHETETLRIGLSCKGFDVQNMSFVRLFSASNSAEHSSMAPWHGRGLFNGTGNPMRCAVREAQMLYAWGAKKSARVCICNSGDVVTQCYCDYLRYDYRWRLYYLLELYRLWTHPWVRTKLKYNTKIKI